MMPSRFVHNPPQQLTMPRHVMTSSLAVTKVPDLGTLWVVLFPGIRTSKFETPATRVFFSDYINCAQSSKQFILVLQGFRASPMALHLHLHLRFFIHYADADAGLGPSGFDSCKSRMRMSAGSADMPS